MYLTLLLISSFLDPEQSWFLFLSLSLLLFYFFEIMHVTGGEEYINICYRQFLKLGIL